MTRADLKKWRQENAYDQISLASALNVHPMTVSKWETGARKIPPFLHLALEALECRGGEKKSGGAEKKTRKEEKHNG